MSRPRNSIVVVEAQGRPPNKQIAQRNLKKKPKTRKRKNRNRQMAASVRREVFNVKPCTVNFAHALANPWDQYGSPADVCLPDDNDVPSFKFRTRMRGSLTVGTVGFGFITANPMTSANNMQDSVMVSGSLFTGTEIPVGAALPVGCASYTSNSPFGNATNKLPAARVVCCGLRVRYTGTELNRGGVAIPWKTKAITQTQFTAAGLDVAKTSIIGQAETKPINRQWIGSVWTPLQVTDREYFVPSDQYNIVTVPAARALAVCINSSPGNTFEWDFVSFFEAVAYQPVSSQQYPVPNVSASDSDLEGYSFVKDVFAKVSDSSMGQELWKDMLQAAKRYGHMAVPFASASLPTLEWGV